MQSRLDIYICRMCMQSVKSILFVSSADVVVLNNVFEFFMPVDEQIR